MAKNYPREDCWYEYDQLSGVKSYCLDAIRDLSNAFDIITSSTHSSVYKIDGITEAEDILIKIAAECLMKCEKIENDHKEKEVSDGE